MFYSNQPTDSDEMRRAALFIAVLATILIGGILFTLGCDYPSKVDNADLRRRATHQDTTPANAEWRALVEHLKRTNDEAPLPHVDAATLINPAAHGAITTHSSRVDGDVDYDPGYLRALQLMRQQAAEQLSPSGADLTKHIMRQVTGDNLR